MEVVYTNLQYNELYNELYYNSSYHIDVAHKWQLNDHAISILKLSVTSNPLQLYGICKVHKHFELGQHECVVTEKAGDAYISKVRPYSSDLTPWQWKYIPTIEMWVPYEFVILTPQQKARFEVQVPEEMKEEVKSYIIANCVSEGFQQMGLCLDICKLFDDSRGDSENQMLLEDTDPVKREQKSIFFAMKDFDVKNDTITRWHQARDDGCFRCCRTGCNGEHHAF